jgi:hypothetical protein
VDASHGPLLFAFGILGFIFGAVSVHIGHKLEKSKRRKERERFRDRERMREAAYRARA